MSKRETHWALLWLVSVVVITLTRMTWLPNLQVSFALVGVMAGFMACGFCIAKWWSDE